VRATSSAAKSLMRRSRSASLSVEGSLIVGIAVGIGDEIVNDLDFPNMRALILDTDVLIMA